MGRGLISEVIACIQRPPFPSGSEDPVGLSGISQPFGRLSQASEADYPRVTHPCAALLGLLPFALDLHVLGTPPAFVLSQDQTLQLKFEDLNRHPSGPAKELPTSLFGAPRIRAQRDSRDLRIDCEFRNSSWACYLVFKDRVACCCRDFLLLSTSQLHPIQPRGTQCLFRSGFSVKRPLPLRFHRFASPGVNIAPERFVSFFRGGAEPTSFPPSLSTDFVDPSLSADSVPSPVRLRRFEGRRFYHRRVRCQLRSLTSYFVFQFARELPPPLRLCFPVRGGAASTTAASGVNRLR